MLFGDFFSGLSTPFRAFRLMFSNAKLFGLGALCFALTLVVMIGAAFALWPVAGWIQSAWFSGDAGWKEWAAAAVKFLIWAPLWVVALLTVPPLLLAPLQDPLSEATEEKLGDFTAPPFSVARAISGAGTSLLHTVSRLGLMLLGIVILLPLNFIPVAGSVLYAILSSAWSMWWVCAEYLSGPMARHLMPFSAVLKTMRARPMYAMGMGATLYVFLWVPVLNCFLVPVAVVAGTLMFRAVAPARPIAAGT